MTSEKKPSTLIEELEPTLLSEIEVKTAEINKAKKELVDKLKPKFQDIFAPFLEKWPQVKKIYWTQYTPYFNDGESCEFSVGDLYGTLNEEDENEDYPYDGDLPVSNWYITERGSEKESEWCKKTWVKLLKIFDDEAQVLACNDDFKELRTAFDTIPEDIMRDIFDDHVVVSVTKDGIDVDEFDHD